jgi:hypothetical protein
MKHQEKLEVDIVLTWVDGTDPSWVGMFEKYASAEQTGDKREIRFRDWGLLPYWFRGVERFAPWVRKVHFVTSGEFPTWLNLDSPKLNWVRHQDFIPQEFLPTFSINAIETNLHRISGLADHFIFFNDDMMLTNRTVLTDYFRDELPVDFAIFDPIVPEHYPEIFVNDTLCINRHFSKHQVVKQHLAKWINPVYGKYLAKSMLLLPWKRFPGFLGAHLAQPFRKQTFEEVWAVEPELLRRTGKSRFRSQSDVNQWIFRYWHLVKGEFSPSNVLRRGQTFEITPDKIEEICGHIRRQTFKEVCLNDGVQVVDFESMSRQVRLAFETILPEKSSFEK